MREPDLYEVLGVSSDATAEQIRAAWKRAAHATHPDKGGSAGSSGASNDRFVAVKSAYDVLRDPGLRAEYDATVRGHELTPAQLADLKRRAALFDALLKASNRAHIKVMKVVERVLRPSTLVGMALLAAASWYMTSVVEHGDLYEDEKGRVRAWFNPVYVFGFPPNKRWESPAPGDPVYQANSHTTTLVPKHKVHPASMATRTAVDAASVGAAGNASGDLK